MTAFRALRDSIKRSIKDAKEESNQMRITDLQGSLVEAKQGFTASQFPLDTAIWIKVCERRLIEGGFYHVSEHCGCRGHC